MILNTLIRVYKLMDQAEQRQLSKLSVLVLIMAILDTLGVISIMPFMALMANLDFIEKNDILNQVYSYFDFTSVNYFMFYVGLAVLGFFLVALCFKAFVSYRIMHFAMSKECTISYRLFSYFLHQDYSWFLSKNSADLSKRILSEVTAVVTYGILPLLNLIAYGAVSLALLLLLIIVEPFLALTAGGILGGGYAVIYFLINKTVNSLGRERAAANQRRFGILSESFGGIREIKMRDGEAVVLQNFLFQAETYASRQAQAQVMGLLPRFALEGIAFGGLLILILYLTTRNGSLVAILPILSLYALGAYRLMPALHQVYSALTQLQFVGASLEQIEMLEQKNLPANKQILAPTSTFDTTIRFSDVSFKYPKSKTFVLSDLSFSIAKGEIIGVVGSTGSGKSTLVDILVGLLKPTQGVVSIDGTPGPDIDQKNWRMQVGYVAQQVYLKDGTVNSNIAFGISPEEIDYDRVEEVAEIACINDFIDKELPLRYETNVGERGAKLSGGQVQRIGIARALYHKPSVLILDEATSALDNLTEQKIISSLGEISRDLTVIMIAHRLTTIVNCDRVLWLEQGRIKAFESYSEVISRRDFELIEESKYDQKIM